jgi:hypothetical protein
MDEILRERLLNSIENDRLVLFCGAGLSIPSGVPSAAKLSEYCKKKYELEMGLEVPVNLAFDLEGLAEYFFSRDQLIQTFIRRLIPREPFRSAPNPGHYAIADFLSAGIVDFVLSTNVDRLTESAAEQLGEPQAYISLTAYEANIPREHSPHIKLHGCLQRDEDNNGCLQRDEDNTLWCRSQLGKEPLASRITQLQTWIRARLNGRDVVFIGFWSDWAYLNEVFEASIPSMENALVVIVNLSDEAELEQKAKDLWELSSKTGITCRIVQEPATDFLTELRRLIWINFMNRLLRQSENAFINLGGSEEVAKYVISPNAISADEAYRLRLDSCGVPFLQIAREKRPKPSMEIVGIIQLGLISKGAQLAGNYFVLDEKRIRVINGAGQLLGNVKSRFAKEPAQFPTADLMICAGAINDNTPPSIVRGDVPVPTIVRASAGARWVTENDASELWRSS